MMNAFALAVLLAALAAVAQAGKLGIEACATPGGCPSVCREKYGPQADGTCQDNDDFQRCICLHTNQPMKTGACKPLGGCGWSCASQHGYQWFGFCQMNEDEERCICVKLDDLMAGSQGHTGQPGPNGSSGRVQPMRF